MAVDLHRSSQRCSVLADRFKQKTLFGHKETSDIQDIRLSFDGKLMATFQRSSRIIIWNIQKEKILKEIEDKSALCMDACCKINTVAVGLRSGIIVIFNLTYEEEAITNVNQVEFGFHTGMVLQVRLSKDGFYGISGGIDQYVALWSVPKKVLLQKIDFLGGPSY